MYYPFRLSDGPFRSPTYFCGVFYRFVVGIVGGVVVGTINNQSDGTEVGAEALDGKVLAVYFSASWCAPCKQFTPILKKVYNKLKEEGESEQGREFGSWGWGSGCAGGSSRITCCLAG